MKTLALILAAGDGIRMGIKTPKQYLFLNKKPILTHTIEAFQKNKSISHIFVAVNKKLLSDYFNGKKNYITDVVKNLKTNDKVIFIEGGETRQKTTFLSLDQIVQRYINTIYKEKIIIHDGDRPLLTSKDIDNFINNFENYNAVIPAIKLTEDVINIEDQVQILPRKYLRSFQTPMMFYLRDIWLAHNNAFTNKIEATEELKLLQILKNNRLRIRIIDGSFNFFKIVYPQDIRIAEALLNYAKKNNIKH